MAEATPGGPARSWLVRWTVGVAAVAALVSIGTPLLGIRVFHGADMLLDRPPWQVTSPTTRVASNPIVGDTVSTFMPLHAEARRRLLGGDVPVWTAFPGGGHPLASVPDAGAFGPLNLPYLIAPLPYAPGLAKLAELAVAVGFTFLFLRRIGLSRVPALFGGLVFAYSGFQVVWTNWPQSHVGAVIPALFWAVERAIQKRRALDAVPVALAAAAMLLEGFPSVAGYTAVAVAIYALVRGATLRHARLWTLGVVFGGVLIGFGLAAFQLLPLADRASHLDLAYRVQPSDWHLPPTSLATLAVPNAFGSPVDETYWGPLNYVEIQSFIGASALVLLAGAGAWRAPGDLARGATSYLWIGALVAALLLFVGAPLLTLAQATDLFELNFVGRLRAVLGFLLAGLAALGLHAVLGAPPAGARGERVRLVAVWSAASVVAALGLWRLGLAADVAGRGGQVTSAMVVPAAAGAAAAVLVVASRRAGWRRLRLAAWLVPAVFTVEALAFAVPFWPRIEPDAFYPTTPAHKQLARRLGADRFLGAGGAMFPGTTTLYGLRSLTTNNTLPQPPEWEDLIRAVDQDAFDQSPVFPSLAPRPEVASSPVLDRLSVRFVVTPPNLPVFGRRVTIAPPTSDSLILGPGGSASRRLPGEGPWRAVLVPLARPLDVPDGSTMAAEIRDAEGDTLISGRQRVFDGEGPGTIQILLPEVECATGCAPPLTLEVLLDAGSGSAVVSEAADGGPSLSVVEATDDGLRLEITANVAGYRRLNALPRIRWADTTAVFTGASERLAALTSDLPGDVVLLGRAGPEGHDRPATIDVTRDTGDEIRARVSALGDGYLVVADPLQHGWDATVDGRPVPLRAADHALVAVFVPAGEHEVALRYSSVSWWAGLWISAGATAILLGVGVVGLRRRRAGRRSDTQGRGGR